MQHLIKRFYADHSRVRSKNNPTQKSSSSLRINALKDSIRISSKRAVKIDNADRNLHLKLENNKIKNSAESSSISLEVMQCGKIKKEKF